MLEVEQSVKLFLLVVRDCIGKCFQQSACQPPGGSLQRTENGRRRKHNRN